MDSYQGIVLSGGGAKGPYALGVLLALEKYHRERDRSLINFYCGTSVGALNAAVAAQGRTDKLTALYEQLRTDDILGEKQSDISRLRLARTVGRKPYHYFNNKALRATIERHVDFDALVEADAHLLICATNYLTGNLETFYVSQLVDRFLAYDRELPLDKRRLHNYHRIGSKPELVEALLASSALPFFLPPVRIGEAVYIDGGIGNHTPLRQAAYFSRLIHHHQLGAVEPIVCVINDPARFTIDDRDAAQTDIFGVIRRTIDIFQDELVSDAVKSWDRISQEVALARSKAAALERHIDGLDGVPRDIRESLKSEVRDVLGASTAATARLELDTLLIRPSSALVENILAFDPRIARELKNRGIADCLTALFHRRLISPEEQGRWVEEVA